LHTEEQSKVYRLRNVTEQLIGNKYVNIIIYVYFPLVSAKQRGAIEGF